MRDVAEALRTLIGLEREAFALDTASGSDGNLLVIIKDYTGRGDPDSPVRSERYHLPMIAMAFQRMIERSRCSMARSPGLFSSRSGGMVLQ